MRLVKLEYKDKNIFKKGKKNLSADTFICLMSKNIP